METNDNKQAVLAAIWENPAPAFGCDFKQAGRYWENLRGGDYDERGKIRITQTANGSNIMVFYNGAARQERLDVFTYLQEYTLKTSGFRETLEELAKLYGLTLKYSAEQRTKLTREALAREVVPYLIEALRNNPNGPTAQYLKSRQFEPDGVHFGELTAESLKRAQEGLKMRNLTFTADDFKALGLTEYNAAHGFNCVLPYYNNGQIRGVVLRNTNPNAKPSDRYRYSDNAGRLGYCDRLEIGKPAVIVEGQFDAIRLIQAGVINPIAIGGAKIGEEIARLLKARNISEVQYIPDTEYKNGHKQTQIIQDAINAFLTVEADGEPVIKTLYIAEIPTPDGANLNAERYKIDAAEYGGLYGGDKLADLLTFGASTWWGWELAALREWADRTDAQQGAVNIGEFQNRFNAIYTRCRNPYERQRIKQYITATDKAVFAAFGVTPEALADVDEWDRNRAYNNRIKQAAADLSAAVENGANPETVAGIVARLSEAQGSNTRAEWEAQLSETFEDELKAITEQPDTLRTKWELGNTDKTGKYTHYENIEFWPADITVFCAPTSHGKTMILFQAALDMVNRYRGKTFIYVSCEENKRQLTERALNVAINIPTTPTGTDESGAACFITGTRKRTIKAVIRGTVPDWADTLEKQAQYDRLKTRVNTEINRYRDTIRPRLKFIHTEASAESICSNISHYVEAFRREGVDVGGVFVDYMQLLGTEARTFSRHDELKEICKALHDCAAAIDLPVVIAAQLNREVLRGGLDDITVANIGEGADIERIAHDIFLLWQVDKTPTGTISANNQNNPDAIKPRGTRTKRIISRLDGKEAENVLKRGFMYIEQMKARDGITGGWGLFPFNGERGQIGEIDINKMKP